MGRGRGTSGNGRGEGEAGYRTRKECTDQLSGLAFAGWDLRMRCYGRWESLEIVVMVEGLDAGWPETVARGARGRAVLDLLNV